MLHSDPPCPYLILFLLQQTVDYNKTGESVNISPNFTSRYKYYITSKYKSQAQKIGKERPMPKIVLAISQHLVDNRREKVFKMCFKNQPFVGTEPIFIIGLNSMFVF